MPGDSTVKDQPVYTAKDWENDLRRLTRRAAIARLAPENRSIQATVNAVKKFENESNTEGIIHALTTEVVNIDPKMAAVAESVSVALRKRFPKVEALVLMGSSIHGGGQVRRIINNQSEHDLDWGIITSEDINHKLRMKITDSTRRYIKSSRKKLGLPQDFASCWYVNADNFHAVKLQSVDDATEALERTIDLEDEVQVYLQPSFPASVNETNRHFLLEALKRTYQQNRTEWHFLISSLSGRWQSIHTLKTDHFGVIAPKPKDMVIARQVQERSAEIMSKPFRNILESTKEE